MRGCPQAWVRIVLLASTWPSISSLIDETGCPREFHGKCFCGMAKYLPADTEHKFIVNCTKAHFTDANMLAYMPEHTEVLIFTNNIIPELPVNLFGTNSNTDFDHLEVVDLSFNHIRLIHGKTFHKVSSVKTLILNHNDIEISASTVKPRLFSNFDSLESLHLTNAFTENINASSYLVRLEDVFWMSDVSTLKKLHLEQNEIWTIGSNLSIFCDLPSLQHLYLGDNRLRGLDFRLDCMKSLTYIDLQRNSISWLSQEAMDLLNDVWKNQNIKINMLNNPFVCGCESASFTQWVHHSTMLLMSVENYTCVEGSTLEFVNKKVLAVPNLKCEATVVNYYSSDTVGVLSFFTVFFLSVILVYVYRQRSVLQRSFTPYWKSLTRKVGYSGLSEEEAPHEISV